MQPVSVSELGNYIKKVLRDDLLLSNVTVRGELSSFTETARGHCFFTVKDEQATLSCVMFQSCPDRSIPKSIGMEVIVQGQIAAYPQRSSYQLMAKSIRLHQQGTLFQQLEIRKQKLQEEGLFDAAKKRPLPALPHRIGLITSETGAAITDLVHVLQRRSPMTHLVLYPAIVQGTNAAASMVQALRYFNGRNDLSLVIIGRGGGSFEDLHCFNDEALVREVAASRHPIISAVGHESDTVLTDFAADLRAPTPTAAGELATPHVNELRRDVQDTGDRLRREMRLFLEEEEQLLEGIKENLLRANPSTRMEKLEGELHNVAERLVHAKKDGYIAREHALNLLEYRLEASNPLAILHKGYAVVQKKNCVVTDQAQLERGDPLHIRFLHGAAQAVVDTLYTGEEQDGI